MDSSGGDGSLHAVQLDGLVIIKIIKHAREHLPEPVNGTLLGLDVHGKLEVTGCFPMPAAEPIMPTPSRPHWQVVDDVQDEAKPDDDYQVNMLKLLRDINVDNNTVGWYQSLSGGDLLLQDSQLSATWANIISNQYLHQLNIPSSVVIVYDPFRTSHGTLAIKAYRLTDAFMRLYRSGDFSREGFNRASIDSSNIFEELPLKVHNSNLVHAFLYELRENRSFTCEVDRLSMAPHSTIARDLKSLGDAVHAYGQEQGRYQFYQRSVARQKLAQDAFVTKRKAENIERVAAGEAPLSTDPAKSGLFNAVPAPSRLDTFIVAHSMRQYCEQINQSSAQGYTRLFVSEGLVAPSTAPLASAANAAVPVIGAE